MKANITYYHKPGMQLRDRRPIPVLEFPIDSVLRAQERQRKLEAKKAALEEKKREEDRRRWEDG